MWESRHGFPQPAKLPGGHRRYSELDVEAVGELLRLRERGLSLSAAISRVHAGARRMPSSIFAGLHERRPDLQPAVLNKRAVLALTRAIEDEYCARAGAGILIGSFQRSRFYQQSRRRWRELARSAELAVVLGDFTAVRHPRGAPLELPVAREHPLGREWTLVIDAPEVQGCLSAWEQPTEGVLSDRHRRFEVLWSAESEVVRDATAIAVELIKELAPDVAHQLSIRSSEPATSSSSELRRASALAHRAIGYLGAQLDTDTGGGR